MSSQNNQFICAYHIERLLGSVLTWAISVLEVASFHAQITLFLVLFLTMAALLRAIEAYDLEASPGNGILRIFSPAASACK